LLFVASFSLYLVLALAIDAQVAPCGRFTARPWWAHVLAVLSLGGLYAAWFALSWRPVFSLNASLTTFAVLASISNYKLRNVQEPLNFMDFVLIPQIWRHPGLYQAQFLRGPPFIAGIAGLLAIILLWCGFAEPSILPRESGWILAPVFALLVAAIVWCLIVGPLPARLTSALHQRMMPADSARDVKRLGLAASLLAGLLGWRRTMTGSRAWPMTIMRPCEPDAAPVVIAVQSESFVDLGRTGLRSVKLTGLESARARAVAWGRVAVPVQGAWTLRSEFSFLAGQPLEAFGLDALHPYLRRTAAPTTMVHHLRDAGFATVFIHPFDLDFFNRRRAMPRLGFDRLLGEEAFSDVPPEGYFVPDMALAERALALAAAESRPSFTMISTMENHNPWDGKRIPGAVTSVDSYIYHLRNADRMIARLADGLKDLGRPAVLAFYGDHVPTLPALANPFPDPCTDYFVMGLQGNTWLNGVGRRDCALHELADTILATLQRVCTPQGMRVHETQLE
jgi:hypothetical protein